MADIANPIAQSISRLGVFLDPRHAAAAQQARANRALTEQKTITERAHTATEQQKTLSETEKARGLKARNDSLDSIEKDLTAFFSKHGLDQTYAPMAAQFFKIAQTKNPEQMGQLVQQFVAMHQILQGNPELARQGMLLLHMNPTTSTAVTPQEQADIFNRQQTGRMDIQAEKNKTAIEQQRMRDEQSGKNMAARNASREKIATGKLGVPGQVGAYKAQNDLLALRGEVQRVLGIDPATGKTPAVQGGGGKTIPVVWTDAMVNRAADLMAAGVETNPNRAAWRAARDVLGPNFDIENHPPTGTVPDVSTMPIPGVPRAAPVAPTAPVLPSTAAPEPAPTVPAAPAAPPVSSLGLPQMPSGPTLQSTMEMLSRPAPEPAAGTPVVPGGGLFSHPEIVQRAQSPVSPRIKLDPNNPEHMKMANTFLQKANGDKALARQLAQQAGFEP